MKQELYDLAAWGIREAKAAGADSCRVRLGGERTVEISYRDRKPENIKEASTKSLGLEIFVAGRYSVMSTSDLRKDALKDFIGRAVAQTRLLAEDSFRTLPDPKYYEGRQADDLEQLDPAYGAVTPANRHAFVKAIEAACLEKGGDKVISVSAASADGNAESLVMTSNGFDGYEESTYFAGSASMSGKDVGDRRPAEYASAIALRRQDLPQPEAIGAEAARRTLALFGGKKLKTETLPVIIENRVVGRFGDGFIQGLFGRMIQQKQSFLADKKGQKVGSGLFTLIDDPLLKGGLNSRLFDGDGFAAKKRVIIDGGVLKDFYIDWYYSRKLGVEPTTGAPSNVIVPPGRRSVAEIMKDLGRGILITGFIGGNSNSTTGDMSIGIVGELFEKGVPVQAVSEMNIADNHLKIWHRLVEAANDPYPYSPNRVPSLVFTDVVVSGL
jgi:PmbA protein